jgi:hypothetical protein
MVTAPSKFLRHCKTVSYGMGSAGALIANALCPGTDVQTAGLGRVMLLAERRFSH